MKTKYTPLQIAGFVLFIIIVGYAAVVMAGALLRGDLSISCFSDDKCTVRSFLRQLFQYI